MQSICPRHKEHLRLPICSDLSSSDLAGVKIEQAEVEYMYIYSVYMAHDRPAPPEELQYLTYITEARTLIRSICLAHNEAGEYLLVVLINTNRSVCNMNRGTHLSSPARKTVEKILSDGRIANTDTTN